MKTFKEFFVGTTGVMVAIGLCVLCSLIAAAGFCVLSSGAIISIAGTPVP